ncbi:MAG: ribosome maturation factor RimM [Ancalomicrobiaceae bacterium]|nr:ribosome maturation factor RimM [Ancalomicrobiaceae bacterium]
MTDKRVLLGRCGAAHGIRGEVRVKPYTDTWDGLGEYGPLELEDGSRHLTIERMRQADTVVVVKFAGIADRTAAEALNGQGLFVERSAMPAPDEDDTWYHADLIGLAVMDRAGTQLGTVLGVPNFGAGDLLEIQPASGTSVFLPFTAAFVPEVDLAGGRLVIDPPEDLFKPASAGEAPPKKRTRSLRARDRAEAGSASPGTAEGSDPSGEGNEG